MKPLWKKQIALPAPSSRIDADLGPHRVTVRQSRWPYRSSRALASEQVTSASGAPPWQAAIAVLERALKDWGVASGSLRVTLSNRFTRYLLVPAHPELKREDEQTGYVRHFLVERFGAEAENWIIRLSPGNPGDPLFACAIENGLMSELGRVAMANRLTLDAVEPALVKAFNACRDRVGSGACWFVVVEPEFIGLGLIDGGIWRGIATRRLDSPVDRNLSRILATEQQLIGVETVVDKALVARYCCKHDFPAALGPVKIENLPDCGLAYA